MYLTPPPVDQEGMGSCTTSPPPSRFRAGVKNIPLWKYFQLRARRALLLNEVSLRTLVIVPFWFSTEHCWTALMPFWFLANDIFILIMIVFFTGRSQRGPYINKPFMRCQERIWGYFQGDDDSHNGYGTLASVKGTAKGAKGKSVVGINSDTLRVAWKVHRLTKKELCHSNETWHALNSTFPDTNCTVSFQINPHWISNSGLWKVVLYVYFVNGLENWRRESCFIRTMLLHTMSCLWLQWLLCVTLHILLIWHHLTCFFSPTWNMYQWRHVYWPVW